MKKLLFLALLIPLGVAAQQVNETPSATMTQVSQIVSDTLIDFWNQGNVIYVPEGEDIQTYIDSADAGSTVVLGSYATTTTDTIEIDKELNLVGQGRSGFVTLPVTPSHGTLIGSATANAVVFQIKHDNVRIANLSINSTGAGSKAVIVDNNLDGIVFEQMDVIVNSTGNLVGFDMVGSNIVMRDVSFYITSSDGIAEGVYFANNSSTTQNAVLDAFGVTGTAVGGSGYAYSFCANNVNDANTITLNLNGSLCRGLTGTALDVGVACISTTTNNAVVNIDNSAIAGADYDFYQTGTNQLNVGGSTAVNNKIFGTITYRSVVMANKVNTDTARFEVELYVRDSTLSSLIHEHSIEAGDTSAMLSTYARKLNPTLTGVPAAPTAVTGTNTTQLATTAFVQAQAAHQIADSLAALTIAANTVPYADTMLGVSGDSLHLIIKYRNLAVTATADGLTTGLLAKGDKNITVSSASANNIVCLPTTAAADIGTVITGQVGANGFELRPIAAQAASVYINNVTTNVEAAVPANSSFEIRCLDATHWILKCWDAVGETLTAIIPDAL